MVQHDPCSTQGSIPDPLLTLAQPISPQPMCQGSVALRSASCRAGPASRAHGVEAPWESQLVAGTRRVVPRGHTLCHLDYHVQQRGEKKNCIK